MMIFFTVLSLALAAASIDGTYVLEGARSCTGGAKINDVGFSKMVRDYTFQIAGAKVVISMKAQNKPVSLTYTLKKTAANKYEATPGAAEVKTFGAHKFRLVFEIGKANAYFTDNKKQACAKGEIVTPMRKK